MGGVGPTLPPCITPLNDFLRPALGGVRTPYVSAPTRI